MKLKNLTKKIRLVEARLEKGAKKLAKLKRKLEAATIAGAAKTKKKAGARQARQIPKTSTRTERKRRRAATKSQVKPAQARRQSATKKVKRKLNLSPERRAQLAAAMKARWAAKRAAAETNPANRDFTLGQTPSAS